MTVIVENDHWVLKGSKVTCTFPFQHPTMPTEKKRERRKASAIEAGWEGCAR